jgi:rhodanese-related sulfurtransferase
MNLVFRWLRRLPTASSWVGAAELAMRVERDPTLLIIDVRDPDEFVGPLGHIREAMNLPLNELPARVPNLVREKRPMVLVCKTDRRSSMAADQLKEAGISDVSVLRGGMERWRLLGLPVS